MTLTTCSHSKSKVDKSGRFLSGQVRNEWDEAESPFEIIGQYRSSHGFALNSTQNSLRRITEKIINDSLIAQRLKRIPSIIKKIKTRKGLRLTQIQDIGGCRAIVPNIHDLKRLKSALQNSRFASRIHSVDDYIENPKQDGYRSIHFTVKYTAPEKYPQFDNQKIEIQIRTKLQHSWATALETVDLFEGSELKSGGGEDR